MKEIKIEIDVKEYSYTELEGERRWLVEKAKSATRSSLATYSRFHVGAAIQMANGEIVTGSNQENAAYPSSMCAERTAVYYASAHYPGIGMKRIAIAAWTSDGRPDDTPWDSCFQADPISPCGACRQALLEYEKMYGTIEVILYGRERVLIFPSVASLLPYCFTEF